MLSWERRGTAGTRSAHWSLGVIRYVVTRCLHGPREPMCPPFWAQVELRKCLFTRQPTMPRWLRQLDHTHAIQPMDRVRRSCCTGEMFQPTRLKGQLTPSCLAPLASPRLRPVCPRCFVFIPHSVFPSSRAPSALALIALILFFPSFPPHFFGDSSCIPLPRTHNGRRGGVHVVKNEKNLPPHASLDGFAVCGANVERTIVGIF